MTRPLTERQRTILDLIVQARTDREISETLGITKGVVKAHVGRLLKRIGARSRVEAAVMAARASTPAPERKIADEITICGTAVSKLPLGTVFNDGSHLWRLVAPGSWHRVNG